MNKKYYTFLLILCLLASGRTHAQLDLEHWFPPFFQSSVGTETVSTIRLYLSTDKDTPFKVYLYNNNTKIEAFTISKTQPVDYELITSPYIRVRSKRNTMTVSTFGLHLTGEKSFYASIRMAGAGMSEMISSKGKSALGTEFYVVNDQSILYDEFEPAGERKKYINYQASIMAYEDNTRIKISNYDTRLKFTDGTTDDEINITLNKGQSYIVAAIKADNPTPNNPQPVLDDYDPNLIGAYITSDKKIVVSNGNFLSQGLGEPGANINMDQSMPVDKIGKEYFIVNGLTQHDFVMEKMIMVATQDNTKIYLNDETTPTKTLNKGEYYIGPRAKKFVGSGQSTYTNSDGKVIESKGIYLKATQPIYIYQLIGGFQMKPTRAGDFTTKSSGMLFSYPIDKNYLPDVRQNLSNTIVISSTDAIGEQYLSNKITIKTEDGANIKINNQPLSSGLLSPITGKTGWSYFSRFNYFGDVTIQSDKSLNLDYVGGYRYSGLGAAFTGFSNDPFIIVNGNCIQEGVTLKISNTLFEKIQWQKDGVDIAKANSETFIPSQPGKYTCKLSYMDMSFITDPVAVADCPYTVSNRNSGNVCSGFTVKPVFSAPNESLAITNVEILTQPLNGTVVYDGNIFQITPKENYSGADRFVYKTTAQNGYYEIVKNEFDVLPSPIADIKTSIEPDSKVGSNYYFNLDKIINNQNNETFTYYETESDAINKQNPISDISNYSTDKSKTIYVRSENGFSCYTVKSFQLNVSSDEVPEIQISNVITPNGDGINDVWDYSKLKDFNLSNLKIFDRFGLLVHQFDSVNYKWDGKNKAGVLQKTSTYWVVYEIIVGGKSTLKGMWILLKNR